MAIIFGFQILLTLVAARVLEKIVWSRCSIGEWLLCRKLIHYLCPPNDVLKTVVVQNLGGKALKKKKPDKWDLEEDEIFYVPKNLDLPFLSAPVSSLNVDELPYYDNYRWLVDFTFYSLIVFGIGELYYTMFPIYASKELNFSLVWIFITLVISIKSLVKTTTLYFWGDERSLYISFGYIGFFFIFVLFSIDDNLFDIGLLEAYNNVTNSSAVFIPKMDLATPHQRSLISLYLLMSLIFGCLTSFSAISSLRYSQMYNDALKYANGKHVEKLLIRASFFTPVFVLFLWVRPLARDHLVEGKHAILTSAQFESLRLWASLLLVLIRIVMARIHLQAFLNMVLVKVADLKKEAGRISNVDLQKMIAKVSDYLCVAAVQYFAPVVLLLAMTCILKSLGNHSWLDVLPEEQLEKLHDFLRKKTFFKPISNGTSEVQVLVPYLGHLTKFFNQHVNRAIWNFFLFSATFINFFGSFVGIFYVTRLNKS